MRYSLKLTAFVIAWAVAVQLIWASPAHAGYWKFYKRSINGQITSDTVSEGHKISDLRDSQHSVSAAVYDTRVIGVVDPQDFRGNHIDVSATGIYEWIPGYVGEPAPKYVFYLETLIANVQTASSGSQQLAHNLGPDIPVSTTTEAITWPSGYIGTKTVMSASGYITRVLDISKFVSKGADGSTTYLHMPSRKFEIGVSVTPTASVPNPFLNLNLRYDIVFFKNAFAYPDPSGLPAMNCPYDVHDKTPLNQPVVTNLYDEVRAGYNLIGEDHFTGGSVPLSSDVFTSIANGSDWQLKRLGYGQFSLPAIQQLPPADVVPLGSDIFRRYYLPPSTSPQGHGFGVVMPQANDQFGYYYVEHYIKNKLAFVSPLNLFFANDASYFHNTGPKGHETTSMDSDEIAIPNWFYYYNDACKDQPGWLPAPHGGYGPAGVDLNYIPAKLSIYSDDSDHLNIGNNGHGRTFRPRYGIAPNEILLEEIGSQTLAGISSYVSTIEHEFTHMNIYEYKYGGFSIYDDEDGDLLPDELEMEVGLDPGDSETIYNWGPDNEYSSDRADFELFSYMCEVNIIGPVEKDWANDGINYGVSAPPNVCDPIQNAFNEPYRSDPTGWHIVDGEFARTKRDLALSNSLPLIQ